MAMKMLDAAGFGVMTDGRREADEDNPKGYYEDERVMGLVEAKDKSWLKTARGKVIKIVAPLLPYLPDTNDYKIIFMHRNIHEILASQKKMLDRRGETSDTSDEEMMEHYKAHVEKVRFMVRRRPSFEALELNYKDVLDDPLTQAARIGEFLGGGIDVEKMAGVVDERLYRNRA
jgi:hypothetical protein